MFSDSDTENFEDEKQEGSGSEEYDLVENGAGEGSGLGWVVTLCVVGVFLLVVVCYLKNRIFKC